MLDSTAYALLAEMREMLLMHCEQIRGFRDDAPESY